MAKTLHFTLQGDKLHSALGDVIRQLQGKDKDRPFKLSTVNRLWAQNGLAIRPEFLRITQTDYQSGLQLVDFIKDAEGSRKTINRWVEEQTNDKIKELLKTGIITPVTRLVLTNAIYFKADWLSPFTKEATRPEDFTIPGTPAFKVPMMNQSMHRRVPGNRRLPACAAAVQGQRSFDGGDPAEEDGRPGRGRKEAVGEVAAGGPGESEARPAWTVTMPKFKMTEEFQLKDELVALGMPHGVQQSG